MNGNFMTMGFIEEIHLEDKKIVLDLYDKARQKIETVFIARRKYEQWCGDLLRKDQTVKIFRENNKIVRVHCYDEKLFQAKRKEFQIIHSDLKTKRNKVAEGVSQECLEEQNEIIYRVFDKQNCRLVTIYLDKEEFEANGGKIGRMSSKINLYYEEGTDWVKQIGFVREPIFPTGIPKKGEEYNFRNDFA